MRHYRR